MVTTIQTDNLGMQVDEDYLEDKGGSLQNRWFISHL